MPKKKRQPIKRKKSTKGAKAPRVRKDPVKEYAETIKKAGIAECLTLADDDCLASVKQHVSTQSLAFDRLLNGKGIPLGRVCEFFGPNHIGKSTLLDHVFASVQKMGGVAILAEPEAARDIVYTQRIGVDPAKLQYLHFARSDFYLENILMVLYQTIDWWREHAPDTPVIFGLDALGGTSTREEVEEQLTKNKQPGAAAKVVREAARQIPARLGNTNIGVIICNHEYETFGFGGGFGGKKRETYGGGGLRHLASIRVKLFPAGEWVKRSDGAILGRVIGAKLVKNRLGNPWGEARLAVISVSGVDNVWTLFSDLKRSGLIVTSGGWSAMNVDGEVLKFQGWTGLAQKCLEIPKLFDRLVVAWKEVLG